MTERRIPCRTYRVILECECGGEMVASDGIVFLTEPPKYPHRCNKCNATESVIGAQYPRYEHEPIGEDNA